MQVSKQITAEDLMQIVIHALDFGLTDALRRHADRRLHSVLACYDEHIQRVVMRLSGYSGARGGVDKCCHVQVLLAGLPDVVVEDVEADLYVAISRAVHRAGRTIRRRLVRRRDKARMSGQPGKVSVAERSATI
jgi:ribosome hibernation promoting factor